MPDFINFRTTPDQWGIFKVLERIDAITKRFSPPMPTPPVKDFQTQLKSQLYEPGQNPSELLTGIPGAGQDEEFPTVEKYPLDDLFQSSSPVRENLRQGSADDSIYDQMISDAARKYGIDEQLLRAMIKTESGYDPKAFSNKGAMGLMQLMPGTASELGVKNPYDPAQNIDGGARYFRQMLDRFGGDTEKALGAYNAGPRAVETYKGVPPYSKNYVKTITDMLGGLP